jgi:hypothetical protein
MLTPQKRRASFLIRQNLYYVNQHNYRQLRNQRLLLVGTNAYCLWHLEVVARDLQLNAKNDAAMP